MNPKMKIGLPGKILIMSTVSEKFHSNIKSKLYMRPKLNNLQFGIQHFAGKVVYCTEGFLDKNRQFLPADVVKLLCGSSIHTIRYLFQCSVNKTGNLFYSMPVNLRPSESPVCNKVTSFSQNDEVFFFLENLCFAMVSEKCAK